MTSKNVFRFVHLQTFFSTHFKIHRNIKTDTRVLVFIYISLFFSRQLPAQREEAPVIEIRTGDDPRRNLTLGPVLQS